MATNIEQVDICMTLNTLRPASAFQWLGAGQFGNPYSAIGLWRDPNTTKPTEQEIIDHWNDVTEPAIQNQQDTLLMVKGIAESAEGVLLTGLTDLQERALLAVLLWNAGAIAPDATIRDLDDWLVRV